MDRAQDKAALLELAKRCEAASGADRELDELITVVIDPRDNARVLYAKGRRFYMGRAPGRIPMAVKFGAGTKFGLIKQQHRYTASLDAAMQLVPEGYDWIIEHVNGGLTIGARVGHNDPDRTSWAATPALALTAAALRARAQTGDPR